MVWLGCVLTTVAPLKWLTGLADIIKTFGHWSFWIILHLICLTVISFKGRTGDLRFPWIESLISLSYHGLMLLEPVTDFYDLKWAHLRSHVCWADLCAIIVTMYEREARFIACSNGRITFFKICTQNNPDKLISKFGLNELCYITLPESSPEHTHRD